MNARGISPAVGGSGQDLSGPAASWRSLTAPFVLAFLVASTPGAPTSLCLAQEATSRMEKVVQSYVDTRQFMGAVLVARDGQPLLSKGYGWANVEWRIPNSPSTRFRIASITKQFTAAAILLLEERGQLSTDDLLKKYFPNLPAGWGRITIFNLLTHTSGIPDFTSFPDFSSKERLATTPENLIAWFRDKPLNFQPGERFEYTNSGYVLLGYLIERISGKSYSDFIVNNIFKLLGMDGSGYDLNAAIIERRASGYAVTSNGLVNAAYIDMTVPYSAGGLYSTTEDLLRWQQALFGGRILGPATLKEMTTPFKYQYACGLEIHAMNGHAVLEHGGVIEGFDTRLAYYPDDKLTVVVLANSGGVASDIAGKLAAAFFGEEVSLPAARKEITVPTDVLTQYVGTYELTPTLNVVITLEGNKLMVRPTNHPKFPLFPESRTHFFFKDFDAQVEFSKDAEGRVLLTWRQAGHTRIVLRK